MSYTKREIVKMAYNELALASYDFDLTPEEQNAALLRLDLMMAGWAGKDIQLGYAFGEPSDLDQDSGLPITVLEAVYLGLAQNLAASKGKLLLPSSTLQASRAYADMLSFVAKSQVLEQQFRSGVPRGAGGGRYPWGSIWQPFLPSPSRGPLVIDQGGDLDIPGG